MKRDQASTLRERFSSNNSIPSQDQNQEVGVRTLSITSGKGGVGKTNIVINLAIQLSKMGKRVFLIDADLGLANIDIMLNLTTRYTIDDVLLGKQNINDIILEGPSGFHVLPASSGISEMQELTAEQQMNMLKALSQLKTKYDYILIDTGAGIASNVLRFNAAADEIFVVTNTEPTSMTDAYALMKVMSTRYQVRKFNLIVNQSNIKEAKTVYNRLVAVLNQFLPVSLNLSGCIPRDLMFPEAVKRQTPLSILAPNSTAVKMLSELAHNIDRNLDRSIHEEEKMSFWERVSNWKRK
ncbi:MAG: MinD/ParA family protein [Deltaproteobacteria bacterium]|jgi:flagellar biosynthesis protein FlhG|nr:MinD/ParA family protein [Deltaproteobacteria bacterium]MBT4525057.1 MinD/ParA family protein [Deltaproteobacteria bacterium]